MEIVAVHLFTFPSGYCEHFACTKKWVVIGCGFMENDPKPKNPRKPRNRTYYFREYRRRKRAAAKAVNATVTTTLASSLGKLEMLKGDIAGSVSSATQELLEESTSVLVHQITQRLTETLLAPILAKLREITDILRPAAPRATELPPLQPGDFLGQAARKRELAAASDPLDAFIPGPINRPTFTPNPNPVPPAE